ncbi:hypothetical protein L3X38_011926 [Prunus dulcis]|uniref:Uncharacterized protein n=1 Tax=Prunus dulcis TaxID=3755 RepID=A0AAD4ZFK9_PRUDU|nr:hypothetical protein L3X38_011926 [Prunus dulcis]
MAWAGLDVPTLALYHGQACQPAGSNRPRGLPNDNWTEKKLRTTPTVSVVRRSRYFFIFIPFRRLVSWRRAPRDDVGQMAEATEEKLERRTCSGKSGKPQIWAPTSELGPRTLDWKKTTSRVKLIAMH